MLTGAAIAAPQVAIAQPSSKIYRLGTINPGAAFDAKSAFGSILVRVLGQRWSRLSEQIFRFDKWSACQVRLPCGEAAA